MTSGKALLVCGYDDMGNFVSGQIIRLMTQRKLQVPGARALVLGLAFKENCPDLRNSRVIDLIKGLQANNVAVDVHDPWVDPREAQEEYELDLICTNLLQYYLYWIL